MLLWRQGDADAASTPARRHLPAAPAAGANLARGRGLRGVPANVRASAERLRRELRPERGPVDWAPCSSGAGGPKRGSQAVEAYASGRRCRRRTLVGYFGERLERCAGCDRCRRRPVARAGRARRSSLRLARLRAAVGAAAGPWGSALAGAGGAACARATPAGQRGRAGGCAGRRNRAGGALGRAILACPGASRPRGPTAALRRAGAALEAWRRRTRPRAGGARVRRARQCGARRAGDPTRAMPAWRCAGLGPRALAKHGDALLRPDRGRTGPSLSSAHGSGRRRDHGAYRGRGAHLPPRHRRRACRPVFEALVRQLRTLRDRGLIDMPERSVAYAAEEDAGAFLFAGPCYVTDAGREALRSSGAATAAGATAGRERRLPAGPLPSATPSGVRRRPAPGRPSALTAVNSSPHP